jgi:putative Holliday junction resolvase
MDRGRRLAIDVGTVRVGLATCDPDGILASPLPALSRTGLPDEVFEALRDIILEHEIIEVYVGDPISMSGFETASTKDARNFAEQLARVTDASVRLVDERLTTVTAAAKLRANGKDTKQSRALIDSASAVEILEQALSISKRSGSSPGVLVGGTNE